jgi:cysteinyl-tRNA synthetase
MDIAKAGFEQSMDDDFNSAGALGYLFDLVRVVNQVRSEGGTQPQLTGAQNMIKELTGVLGLRLSNPQAADQAAEPFIQLLIDLRLELRAQKLYPISDLIRNRLLDLGVILEDGKGGTSWRYK